MFGLIDNVVYNIIPIFIIGIVFIIGINIFFKIFIKYKEQNNQNFNKKIIKQVN